MRERANGWAWELYWGEVELMAGLARAQEGRGWALSGEASSPEQWRTIREV